MLSSKLAQHAPALKSFLDSLPKPFHWRVETPEEAQGIADGIHARNRVGTKSGLEYAEECKARGNNAFTKKDRKGALEGYGDAINALKTAMAQKPDDAEEKKGYRMLAVCHSNRAATYLLPSTGQDAEKALKDGEQAEHFDPTYSKGYVVSLEQTIV
jgi:hypothetical protein